MSLEQLELGIYNFDLITNQITMAWLGDLNSLKDKIEFDSDIFDIFVGPFKLISEDKLMACYYTSLLPYNCTSTKCCSSLLTGEFFQDSRIIKLI